MLLNLLNYKQPSLLRVSTTYFGHYQGRMATIAVYNTINWHICVRNFWLRFS